MAQPIPDVETSAQGEVQKISVNRHGAIFGTLDRMVRESAHLNREDVVREVTAFHVERMSKVPPKAKYPEAQGWAEYQLKLDARVKGLANLSDEEMAVYRSISHYLSFRGYRKLGQLIAAKSTFVPEKCRVAYVPDTDRGVVHIKNLDDPITYWKKRPTIAEFPKSGLTWDATGSGLHIDSEPEDTFPLPVPVMCMATCTTVPEAVEFLTRYCSFFGRQNVLLFDGKNPAMAVEKCSYNFIQVNGPDKNGRNHISGMVCRDINSPIGAYQAERRKEYLRLFGLPDDGPDALYWAASGKAEGKLARFLSAPSPLNAQGLVDYFITPRPEGLNKNGDRVHPDQVALDLTLATTVYFVTEKKALRWQREPADLAWPKEPERYSF
jgi:hypothetical protein